MKDTNDISKRLLQNAGSRDDEKICHSLLDETKDVTMTHKLFKYMQSCMNFLQYQQLKIKVITSSTNVVASEKPSADLSQENLPKLPKILATIQANLCTSFSYKSFKNIYDKCCLSESSDGHSARQPSHR
jgi:hypothetical protein